MKKIVCALTFTTLIVLPATPVLAEPINNTQVSINAPNAVAPNSDFFITVDISQVENLDACSYNITFNSAVIIISSIERIVAGSINGTTIPISSVNLIDPSVIKIVQNIPEISGVNGSGYLCKIPFHVVAPLGSSSNITLGDYMLSNTLAESIPTVWTSKSVKVEAVAGDANADNKINALDITKVERIVAGLDPEYAGADANLDGEYDACDITKTERIIAGLD